MSSTSVYIIDTPWGFLTGFNEETGQPEFNILGPAKAYSDTEFISGYLQAENVHKKLCELQGSEPDRSPIKIVEVITSIK